MQPIPQIQQQAPASVEIDLHPVRTHMTAVIKEIAKGAFAGLLIGGILLAAYHGAILCGLYQGAVNIQPLSFMMVGVITASVVESAKLIYMAAIKIIGDRAVYTGADQHHPSTLLNSFRRLAWKGVIGLENLSLKLDSSLSNFLRIRTVKQINELNIPNRELTIVEMLRTALFQEIKETFDFTIPLGIGIYTVKYFGKHVSGGDYVLYMSLFSFALGYLSRITKYLEEQQLMRLQAQRAAVA